jgi:hypothetical protein
MEHRPIGTGKLEITSMQLVHSAGLAAQQATTCHSHVGHHEIPIWHSVTFFMVMCWRQGLRPSRSCYFRPHLHWTQICPGPIRHGCLIRLATTQTAAFHLIHLHWPRRLVPATPDAGPASGQNKLVCFQPGILIRCLGEWMSRWVKNGLRK